MDEQSMKPVVNITINYEDGTHEDLQYYSVVGLNNMLVELSSRLLKSIDK